MRSPECDVAVVGLGGMGSSALAHGALSGARAVGLEAFTPGHALGSSHGDSRIIRLGYFEDLSYVPLLKRAYENWHQLERLSGEDVITITGVLQIGRPDSAIVSRTLMSCQENGFAHEVLDPEQMRQRFGAFALDRDEIAVLEHRGGFIRPENAIAAHLSVARRHGAEVRTGCRVSAIEPDDAGVTLVLGDGGSLRASRVIVATGPWIAELVPALRDVARPIRQVVAWYEDGASGRTALGAMPVFLRDEGAAGSFFGFPNIDGRGVKVGKHAHFREEIAPGEPNPPVNARDTDLLDGFVRGRLPGVAGARMAATTCRYTMTPSEDFLIDRLPGEHRIVIASPCSGHGYKFASVVGEILSDLALHGGTSLPIAPFTFARQLAEERHGAVA